MHTHNNAQDFDETAFRAEVREFVKANLDPVTRQKVENGLYLDKSDYIGWQKALRRRGWFGAAWAVRTCGKSPAAKRKAGALQRTGSGRSK